MKANNVNKTPYTKRDVIDKLRTVKGFSVKEASEIYDIVINGMYDALLDDRKVVLYRIGTIRASERKAFSGRNPKTGEAVEVPARRSIVMRPSEIIKRDLLGEGPVDKPAQGIKKAKKTVNKIKKAN